MNAEQAQIMALQALAYLAADSEQMERFAALSGMGPSDIMERAADPELLAGVMDFLLSDEALLTDFCDAHDLAPETPALARQSLPGGALPHWT